jgi:putative endonuclease
MFYLYVLKSKKSGELYFGFTGDLKKRFAQHNSGEVQATKINRPFVLAYYEAYFTKGDAKHREYSIKLRGNTYQQLKRRIRNCVAEAK